MLIIAMSDNRYYVKSPDSWLRVKDGLQVIAELLQHCYSVLCSLHNFVLGLKHFSSIQFRQHSHDFPHAPTRSSENLQTVHSRNEQRDAAIAHHADALRIPVKCLEFESCKIKLLQLFGGIRHIRSEVKGQIAEVKPVGVGVTSAI
jgi:hypothetical protein